MFQNMTTKGKLATILVISFILHLVATLFLSHLGNLEFWQRITAVGSQFFTESYYTSINLPRI